MNATKKQSPTADKSRATKDRARADSARTHHLFVDVTTKEKKLILAYCNAKGLSVSQFLAEVALEDARLSEEAKEAGGNTKPRKIEITLSPRDYAKVMYKARLRETDAAKFIEERLVSVLRKSKEFGSLRRQSLRYYVSDHEHETLLAHMKKHGYSSRHYVAMLALGAVESEMAPISQRLLAKKR